MSVSAVSVGQNQFNISCFLICLRMLGSVKRGDHPEGHMFSLVLRDSAPECHAGPLGVLVSARSKLASLIPVQYATKNGKLFYHLAVWQDLC